MHFFPLFFRECDHHEMCKTSLQVLSMILKDKNNHDVSAILHKILSANHRKVLEAFIDNHGKSIIIHQVINTEETKMWWEKIVNKNSNKKTNSQT